MFLTYAAFALLVILLVWMGFFTLGSLPLLVLKHDTPLDARFIRGLFDVYYKAVMLTATVGALAHLASGRLPSGMALAAIALIALASRRTILGGMDRLRAVMTPIDAAAIRRFRRLHVTGMALNFVQLVTLCIGMTQIRL
jgi:hypothetical protein